jgi:hypothetical protein
VNSDALAAVLAPHLHQLTKAVHSEHQAETVAAYEVGYERGYLAGYDAAERDAAVGEVAPDVR